MNTDSKQQMRQFRCQFYSFSKQTLSQSTTSEVHALKLFIMFVCFIEYNKNTVVTGKCVVFTELHGYRANSTFCVQ